MSKARSLAVLATLLVGCGSGDPDPPPFEAAESSGRCVQEEQEGGGVLWGRVESADSIPLEGAQVFIRDPDLAPCGTLTDPEGRFLLEAVPDGTHLLVVQLLGYETDSMRLSVAADTTHASVRLRLMKVKIDDMIVRPLVPPADTPGSGDPPPAPR